MSEIEDEVKAANGLILITFIHVDNIDQAIDHITEYFEGNYFIPDTVDGAYGAPWTFVVDLEKMEVLVTDNDDPWIMITNSQIMQAVNQANND